MKVAARLFAVLAGIMLIPALALADAPTPSLAITSPQPGLTIATDSVTVEVTYAAPEGSTVTQLELLVDGNVIETRALDEPQASGSASFVWTASRFADGSHTVTVRATDSKDRADSVTIDVLLQRNQPAPPPVRISAPLTGQTVSGTTSTEVEAGQRGMIKYVIFLVDDVFKAMSNVSPFTYLWDTTRYLNGIHRLQTKVYFKTGGESLSPVIEVRVDNPGGATTMQGPRPAAPEPVQPPSRAAEQGLPAPMRTESPSLPPPPIQIASTAIATPGTAPYVSPAGELVVPAAPAVPAAPVAAPAPPAAISSATALPAPVAGPAEAAVPRSPEPKASPIEIAALPTPEAPLPPAASIADSHTPAPVAPGSAGIASRPAASGAQIAMLPPLPTGPVAAKAVAAPEPVVAPEVPQENVYVVQPNDCLWSIAAAHGVSAKTLAQLNGISDSDLIYPGQRIELPAARIYCDGKPLAPEVSVVVAEGRAIVPLRAVVESAGGTVTWEPADRQAAADLNSRVLTVRIGSKVARIDGSVTDMGSPAALISGRTMVPLRFLGQAFDLALEYQAGVVRIATLR